MTVKSRAIPLAVLCLVFPLLLGSCNGNPSDFVYLVTESASVTSSETAPVTTGETPAVPSDKETFPVLVTISDKVARGSQATVTVKGEPSVTYAIEVRYSSGVSTAKGLEPKTADEEGFVSWTWRVGSSTKPGTYPVTVSGNGNTAVFTFTVTEQS